MSSIWNKIINLATNVTGVLPVANGGTGTTTSTGTVNVVLSTSPTLITPTLGAASATSINFGGSTLSHYDEGTFTVSSASTAGTATTSGGSGLTTSGLYYRRIGNIVFGSIVSVSYSSPLNITGTGTMVFSLTGLSGLPSYTSKTSIGGSAFIQYGGNFCAAAAISAATLGGSDLIIASYQVTTGNSYNIGSVSFFYTL